MKRVHHVLNHLDSKESEDLSPEPCGSTNQYRFTLDLPNSPLTKEQRDFYEENGFLVIRNLLDETDVKKFYDRFDNLVANPAIRRPEMTVMRDVSEGDRSKTSSQRVTKLQIWARDPVLWEFACHPNLAHYTQAFTGPDIRAMHFMVINKPPDNGKLSSRHPLHQDLWYFPFGPAERIVCAWTALEHVYRRNGCLCVVPGSHKNPPIAKLVPHGYPAGWQGRVNKAYHSVQVDDVDQLIRDRVHLEMQAGDTVFFHPLLVHGSGANLTHGFRRSISVHFASSTTCRYVGSHIPEQESIAREIESMAKVPGITFEQVWKFKSRQVRGEPGHLGHNIPEEVLQEGMMGAAKMRRREST